MYSEPLPIEEIVACGCIIVFCVWYMFNHWDDFFPY